MREPAAPSAPKLSEDLRRFAAELEIVGDNDYTATPEGQASLRTAMAGVMRMFAVDAERLEHHLALADARIASLLTTDHVAGLERDLAITRAAREGKVIDARAIFLDERDFARARRESGDNGSAA